MDKSTLALTPGLTQFQGFALLIGLGLVSLAIAFIVRQYLVRNTHDFIISGRKVGFGFGVGSVIAVWTWAMAVLMSSAMTYQWGLSGLFWFVVPNGLAVMAVIPFARILRKSMPHGYTISEFINYRFNKSGVASTIVTLTMIFGIVLEILINLKGTSIVISSVFGINWALAAAVGIAAVLAYSYFGGLWTSVITATINTLMITVPAGIIVVLIYDKVPGGAQAVLDAVGKANPANLSVLRPDAAAGFGITLAFGLLAATIADQTFWQKVWSIRASEVSRTFLWAGALFYPIPIALGMIGLVGIAYGITPGDIGGDIAAIGPYVVSHIGLPVAIILVYVLVILAACYSTIDGASAALSSVVAIDIVKRYAPSISERRLFIITKISTLLGGVLALAIVLSGVDFTTLVLTTYALKTAILLPLSLAIIWPRTNTIGFVGGIVLAIIFGMTIRAYEGELIGTLSILAISGFTVVIAAFVFPQRFDSKVLLQAKDLSNQPEGRAVPDDARQAAE